MYVHVQPAFSQQTFAQLKEYSRFECSKNGSTDQDKKIVIS